MNMQFDKIKTLKAIEDRDGNWMLKGSYYKMKDIYSFGGFELIAKFNTLEECKMFSDLNLSNIKLHVVSYKDLISYLSDYWFS